ncbi:MAG: hypothetical protein ACRDRS_10725 [Pseudonocardiaceae bacterium]
MRPPSGDSTRCPTASTATAAALGVHYLCQITLKSCPGDIVMRRCVLELCSAVGLADALA